MGYELVLVSTKCGFEHGFRVTLWVNGVKVSRAAFLDGPVIQILDENDIVRQGVRMPAGRVHAAYLNIDVAEMFTKTRAPKG